MTSRLLTLALCLTATAVWAEEEAAAPEGHGHAAHAEGAEHHDTPTVIIHHVSDDLDYEFELPWLGVEHNPTLHLGEVFSGLVFEKAPGACAAEIPKAFDAFPGLGAWFVNGCYDLRPTKSILMMWIAAAILLLLVFGYSHRDSSKLVPRGVGPHIIEILVLFVRDEIAVKNIGKEEAPRYTSFLTTLFFFILTMNWLGLVPNFGSATGNLAVTAALAICTFVLTQIAAFRSAGPGGFIAHLTGGAPAWLWPIMVPVEILGLFTKPFALTVRLFANMLAGHMVLFFLLGLIFMLHPAMAIVAVPMATAIYFLELFVGLVQAYIFTLLSALYIGMAVAMGHHAHDDAHAEKAH